uniref:Lipoprotein n=1 Tax=Hydrogenovibrio crunogenus (strain DSM 25203 / XCL-2) TaxID=317025 RepID=Q31F64_HYDCU
MKKLLVSAAVIATLSLGACSSNQSKSASSYDSVISEATSTHAIAKKNGYVWKQKKMKKAYVDHYIAKAEEAKKKGDDKAAMKYANEALKTANAEVHQMKEYADLKPAWIK